MPVDVQCPGACARADPRTVHDTKDRMRHRRRRSSSAQHQRWIRRRHARPWRVRARSATADLRSTTGDAPDRPDRSQNRAVTATERHGSQPPRKTRIHTGQNSHGKTRITRINRPRKNTDKHARITFIDLFRVHLCGLPWLSSPVGDAPDRPDRSQNRAVTATERHGSQPPRTTRIHTGQNSHGKTRITRINKPRINADKHGWHLSTYPCSSVFFRG